MYNHFSTELSAACLDMQQSLSSNGEHQSLTVFTEHFSLPGYSFELSHKVSIIAKFTAQLACLPLKQQWFGYGSVQCTQVDSFVLSISTFHNIVCESSCFRQIAETSINAGPANWSLYDILLLSVSIHGLSIHIGDYYRLVFQSKQYTSVSNAIFKGGGRVHGDNVIHMHTQICFLWTGAKKTNQN